jgi:adenylate cyclase
LTAEGLTPQALEAKSVELTILFSDIRGFTTLSETRAPAEIMGLLNDYFSRQVAIIFEHHGTLDKFIGDAIMAFWGAPMADKNHALNAVKAAMAMSNALDDFKQKRGLADFDIGIGVHTGPAVVGMLGSDQRLEYTAIGDTINLGSRLEGLTKDKARILVSESTMRACGGAIEFRAMGSFQVKGRNEAVTVFEPLRLI